MFIKPVFEIKIEVVILNTSINLKHILRATYYLVHYLFNFINGYFRDLLATSSVRQGLIGCFRGLVVNGEVLDIYSYMSVHLSEIIKDCKPSCDPNPCKNGAKCKELWSTFQCICQNPWAHIGTYCETSKLLNIKFKSMFFFNLLVIFYNI